jgi:peptidoglycan hydrolase-like protein with peptidoglycan-binding domain
VHHRRNPRTNRIVAPHALPAVAAIGVVVAVVIAGGLGGVRGSPTAGPLDVTGVASAGAEAPMGLSAGTLPTGTTTTPATSSTTSTSSTSTSTTVPPSTDPPVDHLRQPLGLGMTGDPVRAVQTRLDELGFFVGPIDGQFGRLTEQAVWAYEKLVLGVPSHKATGIVTDEMWVRMQGPSEIEPRRTHRAGQVTPRHTEVYLTEQVVVFFVDDEPALISHMSSGTGEEWREVVTIDVGEYGNERGTTPIRRGEIGVSWTPGGVFRYRRFIEGTREGSLGTMWNPGYFNYGIAIHGALNVPLRPASHGCIRVPLAVGEAFHEFADPGDMVLVWDGEHEPEHYGAQPPIFNRLDPEWAATTTTLARG